MTKRKCFFKSQLPMNAQSGARMISIKNRMATAFTLTLLIQSNALSFFSQSQNSEVSNSFAAYAKMGRKGKYTETPSEEHYNSGIAKYKAEDYDGAIDAFLQATYFARNAYYPDAYFWLGLAYMEKNEDNKAVDALQKCASQSVEEPTEAFLALAEIHLRNKRWDECDAAVKSIKKYDKKTTQKIQYIYGLMEDKKADEIVFDPSKFKVHKNLAVYQKKADFERQMSEKEVLNEKRNHWMSAMSHYEQALGEKPWTWTKVWLNYCEDKMKLQRWAEALRELNALLNSNSIGNQLRMPTARLHKDIGVCRLAIGDHQGAIDNWDTALSYNKDDYEVWLQRAMLLETERHLSAAASDYKEFLRLREGTKDERVPQVRDRLTKIEHMLNPNDAGPKRPKPSPYMRQEMSGYNTRENQQQDQQRRQQKMQELRSGDSGF